MRKTITIGDLGEVITGKTPLKTNKNYYGDYALFIKPTDISEDRKYTYETEDMYSQLAAETYKTSLIPKGSICVPCIGTIGTKMTMSPCDCYTNQSINTIVCNERYDNEYVYYLIKNFLPSLKSYNLGTASGREYVSKSNFEMIEIDAEQDLTKQKRIGAILSRYDTLIENYQKQIKLLEEAAQRLYKEWFVDLRFPGYEKVKVVDGVPEGWERKKLGEIIELDPKVPLAKERVKQFVPMQALSVNSMVMDQTQFSLTTSNSGSKFQNGDTLLARITPCLENGKTAYVNCIESNEGGIGSTEYIVMRSLCYSKYMVYLLARSYKFREYAIKCMSGSDGRQRVQKDKLSLYMICVPQKNLIAKFDCFAKPIFAKIKNLSSQIRNLTESRDRMLVKLMSGEIPVE